MPPELKRPWTSASRSVSPPLSKRRATGQLIDELADFAILSSHLRIFSWNVNGVNTLLQKRLSFSATEQFPLRKFLQRHKWPQFLCLQEVKINRKDEVTQRRLQHAANSGNKPHEPTYIALFSLPRDKWNATGLNGRVYGVATLIRDDFCHHVKLTRTPGWDLEGRVLIHELDNGLTIINGYWVNGTTHPYRNPETGAEQGTRHDHKLRFHWHMLNEALALQQAGHNVVLIGDMNVARHRIDGYPNLRTSPHQHVKNRADFNEKFFTDKDGLNAIDVLRELHGDVRKYTYYPRGCAWGQSCDRVDLIISTGSLFHSGAIIATDICETPDDRDHSDHVPLWIEINAENIPQLRPGPPGYDTQGSQEGVKETADLLTP